MESFIKTRDKETADILAKTFKSLPQENGMFVFVNCPKENFNFEAIDENKYIKTNSISF